MTFRLRSPFFRLLIALSNASFTPPSCQILFRQLGCGKDAPPPTRDARMLLLPTALPPAFDAAIAPTTRRRRVRVRAATAYADPRTMPMQKRPAMRYFSLPLFRCFMLPDIRRQFFVCSADIDVIISLYVVLTESSCSARLRYY